MKGGLKKILAVGTFALACGQIAETPKEKTVEDICKSVGETAFRQANANAPIGERFEKVLEAKESAIKDCLEKAQRSAKNKLYDEEN